MQMSSFWNKVPVNEETIGGAEHLKLVCVTATGTDNLDKDYLKNVESHGEMWQAIQPRQWHSTPLHFVLSDGTSSLL